MKNGILVVNKPAGLSSAGVVSRFKRMLKVKKIGHTGTLDPFATGVLLLAVGQATRISRFFLDGSKAYRAKVCLGKETDTYDCTGQVVHTADPHTLSGICLDEIHRVVAGFNGVQMQTAPAYSALKQDGVPLYKLARQGRAVQKPPRQIEIFKIAASGLTLSEGGYPEFDLEVHCSGGTYIRSIAYDIGKELGCGAHLSGLIRTRSGQFRIEDAMDLDAAKAMSPEQIASRMIPMSHCLDFLPYVQADETLAQKVKFGQKLSPKEVTPHIMGPACPESNIVRVLDPEQHLIALIEPVGETQNYNYCCVFNQ